MSLGPTLPGAGGHPLFLPLFLSAVAVNFLAVLLPDPVPLELLALAVPHGAFTVWLLYCDRGMRRQRAAELARYRALRAPHTTPAVEPTVGTQKMDESR